ncbi:hypothetical protein LWM68_04465 [Niabella sp. W65]|nr:hypothetical protein [Niabella sp. W65]MCH7362087.1 hypothetical protein [Niabella sp. W65]
MSLAEDRLCLLHAAGDMSPVSTQYLLDLLDLGTLTKVKYAAKSMGIDALLEPYVSRGLVEIVGKPDEALIPVQPFLLDGVIQDANWKLDVEAPAASYPAGAGLQNVVKATLRAKNGTLVIQIPKEYEFDMTNYKSLKFKVYAPPKSAVSGIYAPYQGLWMRIMNYLWAFTTESSFGQQYWEYGKNAFTISDANLQTWTDVTVDLSQSVVQTQPGYCDKYRRRAIHYICAYTGYCLLFCQFQVCQITNPANQT